MLGGRRTILEQWVLRVLPSLFQLSPSLSLLMVGRRLASALVVGVVRLTRAATEFCLGATHSVALAQQGRVREQGEVVPRPYAK
jgi:hypothetical protein